MIFYKMPLKLKNLKSIRTLTFSYLYLVLLTNTLILCAQSNSTLLPQKIKVDGVSAVVGDYVILEALEDLIIGMTACSAEDSNGGTFKPIEYLIYD